jgi:hypothetical protein
MLVSDFFTIIQTIVFFLIAMISVTISYLIYSKDPSYKLNRAFALGVLILGITYIFSFLGNTYYVVTGLGEIFFIRTAFFLAPIAFMFFYFTALGMYKGIEFMFTKRKLLLFGVIFLIDFLIIYIFEGVVFKPLSQNDVQSTTLFKITVLGVTLVLYLIVFYYFTKTYLNMKDKKVRINLKFFLIGWIFGGFGLISIAGSDFIRELDLIGPISICLGMFIVSRGFLSRLSEGFN